MEKSYKIVLGIVGMLVVVGFAAGIFGAIKGLKDSQIDTGGDISFAAVDAFQNEIVRRAVERGGQPIEGFDAFLLMRAFPGLKESDFDGVETFEGMYEHNGGLIWRRANTWTISTAEKTISSRGYERLLRNLSARLRMSAPDAKEVFAIIDAIDIPSDVAEHIASKQNRIVVHDPRPLSVIASPLTVRGEARGLWYFEATFPVTLVDWDGRIIAQGFASAVLDPSDPESTWMTEEFVPFEGTIEFSVPEDIGEFSRRGALIFQKDNPSGLPEHADALEIPILFR